MAQITLYHLTGFLFPQEADEIKKNGLLQGTYSCLGGQENGIFFFTTSEGVKSQIKLKQEENILPEENKDIYLVKAILDSKEIHYPEWKLDTEACGEAFFNLFLNKAKKQPINLGKIKISTKNNELLIEDGMRFHKYKTFTGNESGLVEEIATQLYIKDASFKSQYDKLLSLIARGEKSDLDKGFYAIKASKSPKISDIQKVKFQEETSLTLASSRIARFYKRYGR